jgi:sugar phosphate isomerase/epimerase
MNGKDDAMTVRRDILKGLVFASLLAGSPAWARHAGKKSGARPLGLQLFTVLKLLEADFEGTLKLVSSLGYREVETLGSFGRDPRQVRESFARHGLISPSQHMMPGDLYGYFQKPPMTPAERAAMSANFDGAFEPENVDTFVGEAIGRAKLLGQKYVVWQLAWRPRYGLKDAERYARAFNRAGTLCAEQGLGFAYHNHDAEFVPTDGVRPFDILVGQTDPRLVKIEIDFMWATKAGADPIALMRNHPGRFRLCHLKDRNAAGEIVTVGEGVEDFPTLIAAAKQAGIEHYYLEFDRPGNPEHEIRRAATFLKPLLAQR